MKNAFDIVRDFEAALCEYTGAPYAVAVNSCTNALFLALKYQFDTVDTPGYHGGDVFIPNKTYISVPMQIKHAGFDVKFEPIAWEGMYELYPLKIWDAARRFTSGMYNTNMGYICVSFHWNKILGVQQGGAILHNNWEFDKWARKARFDGRAESTPAGFLGQYDMLGYHMYMSPEIAAEGLVRLMHLPKNNPDLPNDDYPDLSQIELFK